MKWKQNQCPAFMIYLILIFWNSPQNLIMIPTKSLMSEIQLTDLIIIYENETSYVFEQIPSHSNSEITATALKTDGYSIYDFETDVLQIRQK